MAVQVAEPAERQEAVQVRPEGVAAELLPGLAAALGCVGRVAAPVEVPVVLVHAAARAVPGRRAAPAEPLSVVRRENVEEPQRGVHPASAEAQQTGAAQSGPAVERTGLEKLAAQRIVVGMELREAAHATQMNAAAVKALAPEKSMAGAAKLAAP